MRVAVTAVRRVATAVMRVAAAAVRRVAAAAVMRVAATAVMRIVATAVMRIVATIVMRIAAAAAMRVAAGAVMRIAATAVMRIAATAVMRIAATAVMRVAAAAVMLAGCGTSTAPLTAPLPRVEPANAAVARFAPVWHASRVDDAALVDRTLYAIEHRESELAVLVFDPARQAARRVVLDSDFHTQLSAFTVSTDRLVLVTHVNRALPVPPGARPVVDTTATIRAYALDDLAQRRTEPLWRIVEPHTDFGSVTIAGDTAILPHAGHLIGLDMRDGSRRWDIDPGIPDWLPRITPSGLAFGVPITPVVADDAVVGHDIGAFVALGLDVATGARRWTYTAPTTGHRVFAVDDRHLALLDGALVLVDATTGTTTRIALPPPVVLGTTAVLDHTVLYIAGTAAGGIHAVDLDTHEVRTVTADTIGSELALGGDALFYQSSSLILRAIDRHSGKLLWDWSLDNQAQLAAAPDVLYANLPEAGILAFSPRPSITPRERALIHGRVDGPCRAQLVVHAGDATATTRSDGTFDLSITTRGRLDLWIDDAGDIYHRPHTTIRLDGRGMYNVGSLLARCPAP